MLVQKVKPTKNALLMVAVISLAIATAKLVDLGVRPFLAPSTLFPPNMTVIYKSVEFDAVASINPFGFRGDETHLEQGQIIAVGDSFTFGFGNRDEDAWPATLEARLAANGINKQVYNLGVPGTDTAFHIGVAQAYVERLKPSVVIFSILMSDDLQQVHESGFMHGQASRTSMKTLLKKCFPGIHSVYASMRSFTEKKTHERNQGTVNNSWASDAQRVVLENALQIPIDIEQLVRSGDINPGLLLLAAKFPDRSWEFWEKVEKGGSREAAVFYKMQSRLQGLNEQVKRYGGRLVIVGMPDGFFVKSRSSSNNAKYGFNIPASNFSSMAAEVALRTMANDIQGEYVALLHTLRTRDGDHFFEYDGHLNPIGNSLIAEVLATYLSLPDKCSSQ